MRLSLTRPLFQIAGCMFALGPDDSPPHVATKGVVIMGVLPFDWLIVSESTGNIL